MPHGGFARAGARRQHGVDCRFRIFEPRFDAAQRRIGSGALILPLLVQLARNAADLRIGQLGRKRKRFELNAELFERAAVFVLAVIVFLALGLTRVEHRVAPSAKLLPQRALIAPRQRQPLGLLLPSGLERPDLRRHVAIQRFGCERRGVID